MSETNSKKKRFGLLRRFRRKRNGETPSVASAPPPLNGQRASISNAPPGMRVEQTSFRTHAWYDDKNENKTGSQQQHLQHGHANSGGGAHVSFRDGSSIFQDMERKRQEQKEAKVAKDLLMKKRPWLCRTKFFRDLMESSFELVDQDGSGSVDEKELYSGLLLIHLKLGVYAGPAACKPIDREKCHAVFTKMDADQSGSLDKEEFEAVMMVLFGNVMTRVAIQYACTLLIVPMIAQALLDGLYWLSGKTYEQITTLDEHYELANTLELTLENGWAQATELWQEKVPETLQEGAGAAGAQLQEWIDLVPDSVWNTIPLTLLSTVLSLMLIPWSLLKIDAFFQALADRGNKKAEKSS